MQIIINGEVRLIDQVQTLGQLLDCLEQDLDYCAVALNEAFVPKARYDSTPVKEMDSIEIVAPQAGG